MQGFHDSTGMWRRTRTAKIPLLPSTFHLLAGTPLAAFADGAVVTPGLAADGNEGQGVRWNNHATPAAIARSVLLPADRRPGTDITLRMVAWKTGATVGDAVTFTVGAFLNTVAALYDADSTFGGASTAMTGDAATKTVQTVYRTLASADLPAPTTVAPFTLTVKPTDGTLGTDDVTLGSMYLEYEQIIDPS